MRVFQGMIVSLCLGLFAISASAQVSPGAGTWALGGYVGYYQPDPDVIDDAATGGVRVGYLLSDKLSIMGSLGVVQVDAENPFRGDLDSTLLDVNLNYMFGGSGWFGFILSGGVGYAWNDSNIKEPVDPEFGVCAGSCDVDDSFTANAAIGPVFKVGSVGIRVMNRWRYFDERDDDEIDSELSVAVMIPLGGR